MSGVWKKVLLALMTITTVIIGSSVNAYAAAAKSAPTTSRSSYLTGGDGSSSLMLGLGFVTIEQKDLNGVINVNNYSTGSDVSAMNAGHKLFVEYAYRFVGSIVSLALRPGYFQQGVDGNCGSAYCNYQLRGYTFFPMLRATPLENDYIKFYVQAGIGYGYLKTHVQQGDASADFSGSSFGGMAGLGASFCFTEHQCLNIEGDARYLPVTRNTSDSVTGTFQAGSGFSQIADKMEIEYNGNDLTTNLSGIQGVLAYTYQF